MHHVSGSKNGCRRNPPPSPHHHPPREPPPRPRPYRRWGGRRAPAPRHSFRAPVPAAAGKKEAALAFGSASPCFRLTAGLLSFLFPSAGEALLLRLPVCCSRLPSSPAGSPRSLAHSTTHPALHEARRHSFPAPVSSAAGCPRAPHWPANPAQARVGARQAQGYGDGRRLAGRAPQANPAQGRVDARDGKSHVTLGPAEAVNRTRGHHRARGGIGIILIYLREPAPPIPRWLTWLGDTIRICRYSYSLGMALGFAGARAADADTAVSSRIPD